MYLIFVNVNGVKASAPDWDDELIAELEARGFEQLGNIALRDDPGLPVNVDAYPIIDEPDTDD